MAWSEDNMKVAACFVVTTIVLVVCFILVAVYSGFEHEPNKYRTMFLTMIFAVLFQMFIWEPIRFIVLAIDHATWPQEDEAFTANRTKGYSHFAYLKTQLQGLRSELVTSDIHRDEALNQKYKHIAKDLMLYGSSFVLLLLVVLVGESTNLYYNKVIMERLFRDNTSITMGLSDIQYLYQIHNFLKITLIDAFSADKKVYGYDGWWAMEQWRQMGVVRMRQLRTEHEQIGLVNPDWDNTAYQPEWRFPVQRCHYADKFKFIYDPFLPINVQLTFLDWLLLKYDYFGQLLDYPELAGYEAMLMRKKFGATKQIDYLRKTKWLDRKTWALFIDFTMYNVDAHAFTMVTLVVETTPFGTQVSEVDVECVNVVSSEQFTKMELIILVLYLVLVIQFIRELLKKLWYDPSIMSDAWNRVDLIICLLNVLMLVLWTIRDFVTKDIQKRVKNATRAQYVQFQRPVRVHILLTIVKGFLVCITTLRLWKVLQFANVFKHFTRTLSSAWQAMFSLGFTIVVLLIGLGISLTVPNGSNSVVFHHVTHAIITCLCYSTGFSQNITSQDFFHGGVILGMLLYLLLVFVVAIIMMNVFATVIFHYFEVTRRTLNEKQRGQRLSFLQFLRAEYAHVLRRSVCGITWWSGYQRHNRTVAQNVALQLEIQEKNQRRKIDRPKELPTDEERHQDYLKRVRRTFCLMAVWEVQMELLERLLLGDEHGNLPTPPDSGSEDSFPEMYTGDEQPSRKEN